MRKSTISKYVIKVVILGNSNVGKTSLMSRYIDNEFKGFYKATIGADFSTKTINFSDRTVTLQIWDTAGQERFQSLGISFYRNSDACVLVFDLSSQANDYSCVDKWKSQFEKHSKIDFTENKTFPYFYVGNKADLVREETQANTIKDKANEQSAIYIETSAKTGENVEELFKKVAWEASEVARISGQKKLEDSLMGHLPKTQSGDQNKWGSQNTSSCC